MNKAQVIGNLGRDPEIRTMPSGDKVASFSVATSERWKDKVSGERKERTEWHNITVFNQNLIGVVEQYVKKGTKVYIEGQIETRKWDDKGTDRHSTEIVLRPFRGEIELLSPAGTGRPAPDAEAYGTTRSRDDRQTATGGTGGGGRPSYDLDDDIPF